MGELASECETERARTLTKEGVSMDSEKVIKRDNEYVLHTYNRNPIALEKGHGLYAEGPEGQKYLDFTSGIGVNSLGYCDLTLGRGCLRAGP